MKIRKLLLSYIKILIKFRHTFLKLESGENIKNMFRILFYRFPDFYSIKNQKQFRTKILLFHSINSILSQNSSNHKKSEFVNKIIS